MLATHRAVRVGLVLLLALAVAGLSACGDDALSNLGGSTSETSSTQPPFVQEEGEIFLEPAGTSGPESFAGEVFVTVGSTATTTTLFVIPTSSTLLPPAPSTTAGAQVQVASYSGDTPALYGGSKNKLVADKERQLQFFEQNLEKADAFCAALNADPTFSWSGGTQIQPTELREYFEELTPVLLTRDTRVTNHGYRDGQPTPRQSVLQAGQMVLVDRYGVPRVRCECGNPLCPPRPVAGAPRYTGDLWPGFDPGQVIVVQPAADPIDDLVLVDTFSGETFVRPRGTSGDKDEEIDVWGMEVHLVWNEVENKALSTIDWEAEIAPDSDGSVVGTGSGTWHVDGTTWHGTQTTGTFTLEASFNVNVKGRVETTDSGRVLVLTAELADYTITQRVNNSSNLSDQEFQSEMDAYLPVWLFEPFPDGEFVRLPLDEEAATTASVSHGNYDGSVTLIPLE